jgi:hypothetical protein
MATTSSPSLFGLGFTMWVVIVTTLLMVLFGIRPVR